MLRLIFSLFKIAVLVALGVFIAKYQIEGRTILEHLKERLSQSPVGQQATEVATGTGREIEPQDSVLVTPLPEREESAIGELITPSDKTKLNKILDSE